MSSLNSNLWAEVEIASKMSSMVRDNIDDALAQLQGRNTVNFASSSYNDMQSVIEPLVQLRNEVAVDPKQQDRQKALESYMSKIETEDAEYARKCIEQVCEEMADEIVEKLPDVLDRTV